MPLANLNAGTVLVLFSRKVSPSRLLVIQVTELRYECGLLMVFPQSKCLFLSWFDGIGMWGAAGTGLFWAAAEEDIYNGFGF